MIDIYSKIKQLKKDKNAIILAHFYQDPEIQDIADFLGDSLKLAQCAKETDAEIILFCGVNFMCETAKILNPEKRVILPDVNAGCSLADSAPVDKVKKWINYYPNYKVISYINCSAEVKALSDIVCTSSNAEKIINSFPINEKLLFLPDRSLGKYLNKKTNRNMILWDGYCMVHEIFSERSLVRLKVRNPEALVVAHPECKDDILRHADFIGSTTSIIKFVKEENNNQFIIATEPGVIHQMKKRNRDKEFIPLPTNNGCQCNECPHMRLNTLEKIANALENLKPEIILNNDICFKALKPLEKMLSLS